MANRQMLCENIFTRDSIIICYSAYMLSPVRLSFCLSVTRVDQSKTVEARITKFSPLASESKFHPEILRGSPRAGGALNKGG